ncbi:MAG: S1C family serine protease [Actinomycetes bacterium]
MQQQPPWTPPEGTPTGPPTGPPVAPAAAPPFSAPVAPAHAPPAGTSLGSPPWYNGPSGPPPTPGTTAPGSAAPSSTGTDRPRVGTLRAALIGGLVGAVVAGGCVGFVLWNRPAPTALPVGAAPSRPSSQLGGKPLDIRSLLDKVRPSVVSIHTGSRAGDAAGSGVVLRADGLVLTNAHVIEGASRIEIDFADGQSVAARRVGSFPDNDVAVIQAEGLARKVTPAELGESARLQVGDDVVAIGNALNLGDAPSVTTGIVSALNRSIQVPNGGVLDGLIQTDAAINPGNSGGPLVNAAGQVVGVNTAILDNAQSIGFALSIDSIKRIVVDLTAGRTVTSTRPLLGVETQDVEMLDPAVLSQFGVTAETGAFVQKVSPATGAAAAGLQAGDVIVKVGSSRVRTAEDVGRAVRSRRPGDRVAIVYERRGQQFTTLALLGSR